MLSKQKFLILFLIVSLLLVSFYFLNSKKSIPFVSTSNTKVSIPIKPKNTNSMSLASIMSVNLSTLAVKKQITKEPLHHLKTPKSSKSVDSNAESVPFKTKTYKSSDVHDEGIEHTNTLDSTIDDDILNKDDLIYNKKSKSGNLSNFQGSPRRDFDFLPWTVLCLLLLFFFCLVKFITKSKI